MNNQGIPFGMVFLKMAEELNEDWRVTFSHEVLELIMDPEVNMLIAGAHPNGDDRTVFHWCEVCDAIQTQHYKIHGIPVSNFVLSLYYTQGDEFDGRNDFLGHIDNNGTTLTSFGVAKGGYIGFYDPIKCDHDFYFAYNDKVAENRKTTKTKGKLARRLVRYQKINTKDSQDLHEHDV